MLYYITCITVFSPYDVAFVASIVANVMGEHGEVKPLITGLQSPHHAVLSPSNAKTINRANLLVWLGPGFTPGLTKPLKVFAPNTDKITLLSMPNLTWYPQRDAGTHAPLSSTESVDHSAKLQANDTGHTHSIGGQDPHVWLDVSNVQQWVSALEDYLVRHDANNASDYQANAARMQAELKQFDNDVATRLSGVTNKRFIASHDATQYFEQRYKLRSAGALMANDELGPSAHDMQALQQAILDENISCVIADVFSNRRWVKTLTENTSVNAVLVDVLGQQIAASKDHYLQTLTQVADAFVRCVDPIAE